MAIDQVLRPFSIQLSNGSTATLTEQGGVRTDGSIVVVRTVTDDGAGHLAGGMGNVNYAGKAVQLKVVSEGRKSGYYRSDYESAAAFEAAIEGTGTGGGTTGRKGGTWGKLDVGEELLATASVVARYRVGASAPRRVVQQFTPPVVSIDLTPYTAEAVVPNSVMFRWMGHVYQDFDGVIYRDRTEVSAGVPSGAMVYDSGTAVMYDYVVGGTGPGDFQLLSLWTQKGQWSTASLFFNTEAAPLRPGAGGFVLTVVDTKGATLAANVDAQGNLTGPHTRGKLDFARGGVELQWGDYVLAADLTVADLASWWYSADDVGAVQPGRIWRPWPVNPTTLRYSTVSYVYLPVDVSLMGLDPAALQSDGRAAFARPGDTCVVGLTHGAPGFIPFAGQTYNVGHERLSFVQVLGAVDGAEIYTGYTKDLDAGTVTFTDVTGYPAGGVRVVGRTEVYKQIAEVRIDGKVRLTEPVGYAFPAGAVFSTAVRQNDRFARVSRSYSQKSWNNVAWYDGVDPAIGQASAKFNLPIEVTNRGAITERWAIKFRSDNITFDLIGQHLGQIATGSRNADFAPLNVAAGAPYMVLPAAGWSADWINGNTLFLDTIGAEAQIAAIRCTQPGSPAGIDDSCVFVQRGDTNRPPPQD